MYRLYITDCFDLCATFTGNHRLSSVRTWGSVRGWSEHDGCQHCGAGFDCRLRKSGNGLMEICLTVFSRCNHLVFDNKFYTGSILYYIMSFLLCSYTTSTPHNINTTLSGFLNLNKITRPTLLFSDDSIINDLIRHRLIWFHKLTSISIKSTLLVIFER